MIGSVLEFGGSTFIVYEAVDKLVNQAQEQQLEQ